MSEQTSFFGKGSPAPTSDRTDWETPRELFDRLDAFWHFDLDVAASDTNHLCADYYTKETDGLAHSWAGRRVWCNPPYGKQIGDWARKAYEETRDGRTLVIMLVPARTDTRWYHDYIQGHAAEVKFIRGRLKYTLGGGSAEQRTIPFDACQVGW
jgi:phage N-6-adenine-methyltransferase